MLNNTNISDTFNVSTEEIGLRLDSFLADRLADQSRSSIQRLIENGDVLVNGKGTVKNYRIRSEDEITVILPELKPLDIVAQDIPLEIVYEDGDLLVVNKPKGMVVHPAAGNYDGTMVNALLFHCKESLSGINGVIRPGIVHRIDKNTSGLLIVAKNDIAHMGLAQQIKEHSFLREYEAVVYGSIKQDSGIIDLPIARHKTDRKRMCVSDSEKARNAITHYEVVKRYSGFTHVRLRLETGRTHQIRVHLAYMGHPVAGDDVYGPKKVIKSLNGQCLHAKTIGFIHPVTMKSLLFTSELPDYFARFIRSLTD